LAIGRYYARVAHRVLLILARTHTIVVLIGTYAEYQQRHGTPSRKRVCVLQAAAARSLQKRPTTNERMNPFGASLRNPQTCEERKKKSAAYLRSFCGCHQISRSRGGPLFLTLEAARRQHRHVSLTFDDTPAKCIYPSKVLECFHIPRALAHRVRSCPPERKTALTCANSVKN
jgi:hypothetical protein